ncbi:MAG: Rrf2 family transcriptional regulator [Elusimicrobiota bacterium]|nr:Rrf2 family transcriptional regulator [Elusimicrobiota bacterium]
MKREFYMRLSSKSTYALSCIMFMGKNKASKKQVTITELSDRLEISKIYLEQVFALLKRAKLVTSTKGAQGGYSLSKQPKNMTVYEILYATEISMFEKTPKSKSQDDSTIEQTLRKTVYCKLDDAVENTLSKITLADLLTELETIESEEGYMYNL